MYTCTASKPRCTQCYFYPNQSRRLKTHQSQKSLSLSWSFGVRSLSLSLGVRSRRSLSWSLGVRSLSWSLGVRSLSLSWSLGVRSLLTSLERYESTILNSRFLERPQLHYDFFQQPSFRLHHDFF